MNHEFLIAWLLLMFPMVYSPGPANTLFASNGAAFGLRRSMPFMAGIDIAFVLQSFVVGFGISAILLIPYFFILLRYIGIIYICFLGYKFLRSSTLELQQQPACLTFADGMLLTLVNPKAWIMQIMMFSQFLNIHLTGLYGISKLALLLAVLNISGHIVWIMLGSVLLTRATSFLSAKVQNIIFALMLFGSVIFLL